MLAIVLDSFTSRFLGIRRIMSHCWLLMFACRVCDLGAGAVPGKHQSLSTAERRCVAGSVDE